MDILSVFGGQVVAIVGLAQYLLGSYQSFKYEMEALSTLYFYKSDHLDPIMLVNDDDPEPCHREDLQRKIDNLKDR